MDSDGNGVLLPDMGGGGGGALDHALSASHIR